MKLSAMLYLENNIDEIRAKAKKCIASGVSVLYFPDHLNGGGNASNNSDKVWHAMWPTLIDIGQRNEQIEVGTMVASAILRNPAQLALEASSAASILGNNRFKLTIGAGGAKNDLEILGIKKTNDQLAEDFKQYVSEFVDLIRPENTHLRLPNIIDFRLASESMSTINLISKYDCDWVTTGGWKKTLDQRINKINELFLVLKARGFDDNVTFFADRSDGISIDSDQSELKAFSARFSCPMNEIVVPV